MAAQANRPLACWRLRLADNSARDVRLCMLLVAMEDGDIDGATFFALAIVDLDREISLHIFIRDVILLVQSFSDKLTDLFFGGVLDLLLSRNNIGNVALTEHHLLF